MKPITLIGLSVIFFYSLIQVLKFYGIGEDFYGVYILRDTIIRVQLHSLQVLNQLTQQVYSQHQPRLSK